MVYSHSSNALPKEAVNITFSLSKNIDLGADGGTFSVDFLGSRLMAPTFNPMLLPSAPSNRQLVMCGPT